MNRLLSVGDNNRFGFINSNGDVVVPLSYDMTLTIGKDAGKILEGNRIGFVNLEGKVIFEPQAVMTGVFNEGLCPVSRDNVKWAFINTAGELVSDYIFDEVNTGFHDGLCPVRKKSKWGYINKDLDWVIAPEYRHAVSFRQERAVVKHKRLLRATSATHIDKSDNRIGEPFDDGTGFNNSMTASICRKGKWGAVDHSGNVFIECKYGKSLLFSENLAAVCIITPDNKQKYGYINIQGEMTIKAEYDSAAFFNDGRAICRKDGEIMVIDTKGGRINTARYDDSSFFFLENMTAVCRDGKWGYIDTMGSEVIPCIFDYAGGFIDGFATVRIGNRFTWIDKTGRVLWNG